MLVAPRAESPPGTRLAMSRADVVLRQRMAVAAISFLTLVDLFAAQAILPSLAAAYQVTPATIGFAVNASTIGMAAAGIVVALFSHRIEWRAGIAGSLVVLSIPTALLALQPDIATFTALRVVQGLCMSSAFTLTLAYLAQQTSAEDAAGALAAYVTGNVASNLIGRLMSAALADHFGLAANFLVLAALNIAGAALVLFAFDKVPPMPRTGERGDGMRRASAWLAHLRNPPLTVTFLLGFLILFVFIGTFSYVNFVLTRAPLSLSTMSLGLVYFVFLPALVLTPLSSRFASALGPNLALRLAFAAALAGLPLLLLSSLPAVLSGLALVGAGAFCAQAIATAFVSRLAMGERGAASGLYLAAYYLGGLAGSAILGRVFEAAGWSICVAVMAVALAAAMALTLRLPEPGHTANKLRPR